jgi:hypothetical protein
VSWLHRRASSDITRVKRNIERLEELRKKVHDLGFFGVATQSGGFQVLSALLEENLVVGRPKVHEKLQSALIGENGQKVVLDAPLRFQEIMREAEDLINREIGKERRNLKELQSESDDTRRTEL